MSAKYWVDKLPHFESVADARKSKHAKRGRYIMTDERRESRARPVMIAGPLQRRSLIAESRYHTIEKID